MSPSPLWNCRETLLKLAPKQRARDGDDEDRDQVRRHIERDPAWEDRHPVGRQAVCRVRPPVWSWREGKTPSNHLHGSWKGKAPSIIAIITNRMIFISRRFLNSKIVASESLRKLEGARSWLMIIVTCLKKLALSKPLSALEMLLRKGGSFRIRWICNFYTGSSESRTRSHKLALLSPSLPDYFTVKPLLRKKPTLLRQWLNHFPNSFTLVWDVSFA